MPLIYIVEDDAAIRAELAQVLERNGYETASCATFDTVVGDIVAAEGLIEAGRLKSLGMTPYQHEAYPDIPVIQDSGVEGVENMTIGNGVSLIAPGGLPDEIVQKWNDALEELYADETFLQEMADLGLMPDYKNSADFEAFFRENLETISAVAEKNGLVK